MKHTILKKATAYILTLAMLFTAMPFAAVFAKTPADFVDFPTGWSAEAVGAAVNNGLLTGKTADTLDPTGNLTRAEMATVINRAFGATVEKDISSFVDVLPGEWYYHEIAKSVNMGTFAGDGNNTMRPNDFITREEVFVVIARAIVLSNNDLTYLNKFNDGYLVSDWAKPYTAALTAKGYINGDTLSNVNPQNNITREEFAQLMYNIVKKYYTTQGTFSEVTTGSVVIRVPNVTLSNMVIEGDLILGDGVGKGDITLNNVTIKGRLVARGGEGLVSLVRTTVMGGVVVNDVNGVVNFNNSKSEAPFKGIITNTPATFVKDKKPTGGGGGGGGSRPVSPTSWTYNIIRYIEDPNGTHSANNKMYLIKDSNSYSTTNKNITLTVAGIDGYTMDISAGQGALVGTVVSLPSNNYTFAIYFNKNDVTITEYNITVNSNGADNYPSSVTVPRDAKILDYLTEDPVKEGLTFDGWYSDANFQNAIDENTIADGSITSIYAKWVAKIIFKNGDTEIQGYERKVTPGTKLSDFPANLNDTNTDKFLGWTTVKDSNNAEHKFDENYTVDKNMTVYALWRAKKSYSVKFQFPVGTDLMQSVTVLEDDTITEPNAPSIDYYTYLDGGNWKLKDSDTVYDFSRALTGDNLEIVLVANVRPNNYSIIYYPGYETSEAPVQIDFNYESTGADIVIENGVFTLNKPFTRNGYDFKGWATSENSTNVVYTDTYTLPKTEPSEALKLYAVWEEKVVVDNTWTVTFRHSGFNKETKDVEKGATLSSVISEMPLATSSPKYQHYAYDADTNPTYSHTVRQENWYTENGIPFGLDDEITGDITLYPGWQLADAYITTTRFNILPISLQQYYDPDDRAITAGIDFILANRGLVLEGIDNYQDKILAKPIVQKLFTTDKEIKVFKENIGLGRFISSSDEIKNRFGTQIDQALTKVPAIVRDEVRDFIYKAIDDVIDDNKLDLGAGSVLMDMPLYEVFGGKENFRTILNESTTDVLDSIRDNQDLYDAVYPELQTIIDYIVNGDLNASPLDISDANSANITLGIKDMFGGETGFKDMLDSEKDAFLARFPSDIVSYVEPAITATINELASDSDGKWDLSDASKKAIDVSRTIEDLVGGSDELFNTIKTEVDNAVGDAIDKTDLYDAIRKLISFDSWIYDGSYGRADGFTGIVNVLITKPISSLVTNISSTVNAQIDNAFAGTGIDPTNIKNAADNLLNSATEWQAEPNYDPADDAANIGEAPVSVTVSLDDVAGTGGLKGAIESAMDTMIGSMPSYASAVFNNVKYKALNLVDSIYTTPLKIGTGILSGQSVTVTLSDILGNSVIDEVKDALKDKIADLPDDVVIGSELDTDAKVDSFVDYMFTADNWDIKNAPYNAVSVKKDILIKDVFGGQANFADKIQELIEDDIEALTDDSKANINDAIYYVAGQTKWKSDDNNAKAVIYMTSPLADFADGMSLPSGFGEGTSRTFTATDENASALTLLADNLRSLTFTDYVLNNYDSFDDEFKDAVDYAVEYNGNSAYAAIDAAVESAIDDYADEIDAAVAALTGTGDTTFSTDLTVEYTINVTKMLINAVKGATDIDYYTFEDTPVIEQIVDVVGSRPVINATEIAIDELQDKLALAEPAEGYDTTLSFDIEMNAKEVFLKEMYDRLTDTGLDLMSESKYNELVSSDNLREYISYQTYKDTIQSYIDGIYSVLNALQEDTATSITLELDDIDVSELILKEMQDMIEYDDATGYAYAYQNKNYYTKYNTIIDAKLASVPAGYIDNNRIIYGFNKSIGEYADAISDALNDPDSEGIGNNITVTVTVDVAGILIKEVQKKVDIAVANFDNGTADDVWPTVADSIDDKLINAVGETAVKDAVKNALDEYQIAVNNAADTPASGRPSELSTNIDFDIDVNVNKLLIDGMETYIENTLKFSDVIELSPYKELNQALKYDEFEEAFDAAFAKGDASIDRGIYLKAIDAAQAGTAPLSKTIDFTVNINFNRYIVDAIGEMLNADDEDAITYDNYKEQLEKNEMVKAILAIHGGDAIVKDAFDNVINGYKSQIEAIKDAVNPATEFDTNIVLPINIRVLVLYGVMGKINDIDVPFAKAELGENVVKLIGEEYFAELLDTAKGNVTSGIQTAIDSTDKKISADVFHLALPVDMYRVFIRQLYNRMDTINYDLLKSKIPDKFEFVFDDDIIRNEFDKVWTNDFKKRIENVYENNYLNNDPSDDLQSLDCLLRLDINFVDILIGEYANYTNKAESKFGGYYNSNPALKDIIDLLDPESLLNYIGGETEENGLTGYQLKSNEFYYNVLEDLALLTDEAMNTAFEDINSSADRMDKIETLVSDYIDLAFDYYPRMINLAKKALERAGKDDAALDEKLPSEDTLDELKTKTKSLIITLINDPNMSVTEAVDLAFDFTGKNFDWLNFEKEISKKDVTVKVSNKLNIPALNVN